MLDDQEKTYQIALSLVQGVGTILWQKLIQRFGSACAVFHSNAQQLIGVLGARKQLIYAILKRETLPLAKDLLALHQKQGIQIISMADPAYPTRLKETPQAPLLLYFQGTVNMNSMRVISIVGTRKASSYGKKVVKTIIEELAAYEVIVVSGLAYGIDIAVHQEALNHGIPTIGVLASGLDIIYPVIHQKIATNMLANGGLISEYPLKADLEMHQFPKRNRLIAGMSDAILIIEAAEKSGALITANFANAYYRDVFAIPGNIDAIYSKGTNRLISSHQAHLITSGADLVWAMGWKLENAATHSGRPTESTTVSLTVAEKNIVQLLEKFPSAVHIDILNQQSHMVLTQLYALLLQLELKGLVQNLPGNFYKLLR